MGDSPTLTKKNGDILEVREGGRKRKGEEGERREKGKERGKGRERGRKEKGGERRGRGEKRRERGRGEKRKEGKERRREGDIGKRPTSFFIFQLYTIHPPTMVTAESETFNHCYCAMSSRIDY